MKKSVEEKRINKYLADRGLCSRREAEELIQKGWVSVNDETLSDLSYRVKKTDRIKVSEEAEIFLKKKMTLIIHKPVGYVSAQAEEDYTPAIRLTTADNYYGAGRSPQIQHKGFAPAGRLDIDSTGLLILTQNGKLAKKIISPDSDVEKEYEVKIQGVIDNKKIGLLRSGLKLDGKKLKPAQVSQLDGQKLKFILKEGKKRQIRRMCELVDLKVLSLRRTRIGQLKLGSLPIGKWRLMKTNEKI